MTNQQNTEASIKAGKAQKDWTPEPWGDYIDGAVCMTPNPEGPDAFPLGFEDYQRARACVNYCTDVELKPGNRLSTLLALADETVDRARLCMAERDSLREQRDRLHMALRDAVEALGGINDATVPDSVRAALATVKK